MAKIRGSVALALTFINLFVSIAILSLSSVSLDEENRYHNYDDEDYYGYEGSYMRKLSQIENLHSHLRGTKIRAIKLKDLIEKEKENSNKNKIYDPLDYNEDEFVLPKNILKKTYSKNRKLETDSSTSMTNEDKMVFILLLSCLGISFSILLMFSFCLDTNECCNRDAQDELGLRCCIYCYFCDCNCHSSGSSNCDCKGNGNNDGAAALLILLLVIIVFILLYFAVKACGKHVSRYVAITAECLVNIAIMVLSIMYNIDDFRASENGPILIALSGVLFISNFLGLLLPNLSCCLSLRYGYKPPSNINTPILEQPVAKTKVNEEPYNLSPVSPPIGTNSTPVVQPTVPVYVPQVPQPQAAPPSIYQNNLPYQAPVPQPSSDFYNSGQGGIYNYPPPAYDQPQSIYQAQAPYQQDPYGQIPKPQ